MPQAVDEDWVWDRIAREQAELLEADGAAAWDIMLGGQAPPRNLYDPSESAEETRRAIVDLLIKSAQPDFETDEGQEIASKIRQISTEIGDLLRLKAATP